MRVRSALHTGAMRIALLLASTAAAPALATVGPCSALNVICVGADSACQYGDLQQAINAASTSSGTSTTVHVARNQSYDAQNLHIDNRNIALRGGYSSCGDYLPSGTTTLSGSGGNGGSVVAITAPAGYRQVALRNLTIRDGGTSGETVGGGVYIADNVAVEIRASEIVANAGAYGGGIALLGADGAVLDLTDGSNVHGNSAVGYGGGLYCSSGQLNFDDALVVANRALALGGGSGGNGGGLYLVGCSAHATASDTGVGILGNQADGDGGGVLAVQATSLVLSGTATSAYAVSGNTAGHGGAGIGAFYASQVELHGVDLASNIAGNFPLSLGHGGGLYVLDSDAIIDSAPCRGCSQVRDNVAIGSNDQAYLGGGALIIGGSTPSHIDITDTRLSGNGEGTLSLYAQDVGSGPAEVIANVTSSIIAGNVGDQPLYLSGRVRASIEASTIADNGALAVISATDPPLTLDLHDSIVREAAGTPLLAASGSGYVVNIDCVSVNSGSGAIFTTGFASDQPGFVAAGIGNYHLKADASVIDACPASGTLPATDLDGNPRNVDAPAVPPFVPGAQADLGAYEWTPLDAIFANGFDAP